MTEYATDYAAADLAPVEEAALKALASVGYDVTVEDVAEFCAGYTNGDVGIEQARGALFALDALSWARPEDNRPLTARTWRITNQGRVALDRAEVHQ